VSVAAWTTAVVGAFVLAVSVGLIVYNTISAPIAAEACPLCPYIQKWNSCYMTATDKLSKSQITQAQYKELMDLYDQINWDNPTKSTQENTAKAQDLVKKCEALIGGTGSGTTTSGQTQGSTTGTTTTETSAGKCPTGYTQYAINNYPMTSTDAEDQEYFKKMGLSGDSRCYRCSDVCVPDGINLRGYLSNLTVGDEKITVLENKGEFDALVASKPNVAQKSAVILSSLKGACEGPISIDYPGLIYKGEKAKTAAENTRCTAFWARQAKAASNPTASGTTGASPSSATSLGWFTPPGFPQPSGATENKGLSELLTCQKQLAEQSSGTSANGPISTLLAKINAYLEGTISDSRTQQLLSECQNALEGKITDEVPAPAQAGDVEKLQAQIEGCTQEVRGKIGQLKNTEKRQIFSTTLETITSGYHSTAPSLTSLQDFREQCTALKNQVNQELEKQKGGGIWRGISDFGKDIYNGAVNAFWGAADLINRGLGLQ